MPSIGEALRAKVARIRAERPRRTIDAAMADPRPLPARLRVEFIDSDAAIVRRGPLPEPGPAPFLVVDAGAAGRIVDWVALGWGREPTSPPR